VRRTILTGLAATCLLLAAGTRSAVGAESPPVGFTVGGGPTGAVIVTPGHTTSTTFEVRNDSEQTEHLAVEVTGLHFAGESPQFTGRPSPGLTVTAHPSDLVLAPRSSATVEVALAAAPEVHPGGLYAGVIFTDVPGTTGQAVIVPAQARALIGHVPGPSDDSGHIVSLGVRGGTRAGGPLPVLLTFLDTGTVDYQLHVFMRLDGPDGASATADAPPSLVLPGNERAIAVTFPDRHPVGHYTVTADATWGIAGDHHGSMTATVDLDANGAVRIVGAAASTIQQRFIARPKRPRWEKGVKACSLLLLFLVIGLLVETCREERRRRAIAATNP
jgi:hypothetical protein